MASMLRSSSSRRETRQLENHQSKKIGCMSGIFHLLHSHHHGRKCLTSAGKKEKDKTVISPKKSKPPAEIPGDRKETKPARSPETPLPGKHLRRFSCDVPRSPTLPPEIRRSNSVNSPENYRRKPALVARLMGLEEAPAVDRPESAAEKRQKLLGALEKCDKDLQVLKKIIESVREREDRRRSPAVADRRLSAGDSVVDGGLVQSRPRQEARRCEMRNLDGGDSTPTVEKRCSDFNVEQPSPVSVLDDISSPRKKGCNKSEQGGQCRKLKDDELNGSFFNRITTDPLPRLPIQKEDDDGPLKYMSLTVRHRSQFRGSKAMIETVNEVWKDGIWEERWELGRLGVVLEVDIFGELIEEIVREMGLYAKCPLPFEACRKRLCF